MTARGQQLDTIVRVLNSSSTRFQKPYNVCTSDWAPMVGILQPSPAAHAYMRHLPDDQWLMLATAAEQAPTSVHELQVMAADIEALMSEPFSPWNACSC